MRAVILGCGRVGSELAKVLSAEGHEVSVIDRIPESFKRLGGSFNGRTIVGVGIDAEVLERAGIREADAFVSATQGDNTNIMAALMAKEIYGVNEVVVRIYDPLRTRIYTEMGLKCICPTLTGAKAIYRLISTGEPLAAMPVDEGSHTLLEFRVPTASVGHKLRHLPLPEEATVAAVIRQGVASPPLADTLLAAEDRVIVLVKSELVDRVKAALGTPVRAAPGTTEGSCAEGGDPRACTL